MIMIYYSFIPKPSPYNDTPREGTKSYVGAARGGESTFSLIPPHRGERPHNQESCKAKRFNWTGL